MAVPALFRVFLREYAGKENVYQYSYGRSFRGSKRVYESITRPDVLMLSTLYAANCPFVEEAYQEFSGNLETSRCFWLWS